MTAETPAAPFDDRDAAMTELLGIRSSIDNIDAALIHLLAERFKFTQQVGRLKARHGLPPSDPDREKRQIARLRALAEDAHLDPAFAERWFNFVVAEVIQHHEELAGTGGSDVGSGSSSEPATTDSGLPGPHWASLRIWPAMTRPQMRATMTNAAMGRLWSTLTNYLPAETQEVSILPAARH